MTPLLSPVKIQLFSEEDY